MATRTKNSARAAALTVTPSIAITFDVDEWMQAYGIEESAVWADASEHLVNVAVEAVREAVERLGVGAIAAHQATSTVVSLYRPVST